MVKVVSIKFNSHGKAYYFDPLELEVHTGDTVIVETSKGLDIGECAFGEHYVADESIIPPLRPVIRVATEEDLRVAALNKEREKDAFGICKEKIEAHNLDMKLVDVECGFEGNKILFFFTADGRVDFRDLVKDLAAVFRTRIELRQIGVRDETKMLGGLGICGRPYCCNQFLNDFQPVSTKMAKTQSMSLNPTKISGSCGRLMCCLRYEQDAYEDLMKTIPKAGAFVQTPYGYGNVISTNVLRQKVKVRLDDGGETELKVLEADQVASIPGGRPKPGDPMPNILTKVVKAEETPEPAADPWAAPSLFAEETDGSPRKSGWGDEKTPAPNAQGRPDNHRQEQNRPRPMNNGGRPNPSHNAKPAVKRGNPATTQAANKGGQQAQNPQKQQPVVDDENKPNNKPKNQNRNRKHHYNRPKSPSEGQSKE